MPELPTSNSGSPLTQKRVTMNTLNTSSIPKIDSLEHVERELPPQLTRVRQPLKVDINQRPARLDPEEKGSSAKIVIWVVIVIVLAIAAYLGLKSFLNGPSTTDNGVTPTTYVTPVVEFISTIVDPEDKKDADADSKASFALFTQGAQNMGSDSDTTFDLTKVSVQKYETFTRVAFTIDKIDGIGNLPLINASYDKTTDEITLNILKTTTTLDIPTSKEILVNTLTVDSLSRVTTDNTMEKFLVKLSSPTVYLLQVSNSSDSPMIYLDIKEVTPSVTPTSLVTISPSLTPSITSSLTTPTPSPTELPSGEVSENVYSKDAQILNNGLTNNSASFSGYYYFDGPAEFTYKAQINPGTNGKLPSVSAKLDGLTLTVEVTNLTYRDATATINFTNVSGIQKMDVVSAANKRTYTFTLSSSKEYRIAYKLNDTADKKFAYALWIQIKH